MKKLSDYCINTIVSPKRLQLARKRKPLREKRAWVAGQLLWQQAQDQSAGFPILIGDATDCSRLEYWALLTNVEIRGNETWFTVDRVRRLPRSRSPQELVLRRTGKHIAPNFIRPYAICRKPEFLPSPERGRSKAK